MKLGTRDEGRPPTRPVRGADLTALIGWLAVIEGELMLASDAVPVHLAGRLRQRLEDAGLLAANADERAMRQAINDPNQRLRYALGEYSAPPEPNPVPAL